MLTKTILHSNIRNLHMMYRLSPDMRKLVIRSCATYPLVSDNLETKARVTLDFKDWKQLQTDIESNFEIHLMDNNDLVKQVVPFLSDESLAVKKTKWVDIAVNRDIIRIETKGDSQRLMRLNINDLDRTLNTVEKFAKMEEDERGKRIGMLTLFIILGMTSYWLIRIIEIKTK